MLYDFCIIGGGIVGLATAMKLQELRPGCSVVILEKEDRVAAHQTGHNSGVIHAGIYYTPGSLKAKLCRAGAIATKEFCAKHKIPFDVCGKLIVATNEVEVKRLDALAERCRANQIEIEALDEGALREREPNIAGVKAILSPSTGIVDYKLVCAAMADEIRAKGGTIEFGVEIDSIAEEGASVWAQDAATGRRWVARRLIACAGLQADRIARAAGVKTDFRIVPFRGEYFVLPPEKNRIVKHLIYPAPDPDLPFLGVHLTRMIDGSVTVGPNAVMGFKREGYGGLNFSPRDALNSLSYPGLWKVLLQHRRSAMTELRNSWSRRGYLQECRKYCPSLELSDLLPYRPGIRAQAVTGEGVLVSDFLFAETGRMLHVCNAPSPAATSALPIGEMIARKVADAN